MRKAKVLFFAADPSSLPHDGKQRLELDAEVREIKAKVRASEHRDSLEFDHRLAARRDDLLQALNERKPAIVHFSGHGWSDGLFLMDSRGQRTDWVDRTDLAELFGLFRGEIRVVLLNACLSEPQAEAIAHVVGCAIGMRGEISDDAAIAFGAAFYRAIGFGHSVQAAFRQGRLAVPPAERDCPQLLLGLGMDAGKIFVVEPKPKVRRRHAGAGVLAAGALIMAALVSRDDACARAGLPDAPVAPAALLTAESSLDQAKVDFAERRYPQAFLRFSDLARRGDPEAVGYVGAMLLRGQGTGAHPDSGIYWLRLAAYDRDPKAMTALGAAYQNGEGVNHSLVRAREWYHKAADEKQWPEAMRRLGTLDLREQKSDAALAWFLRAAKAGSLDARVDLGQLYEHGHGRPRDPEVAYCLYRTAAAAGSLRGMQALRELKAN